MRAHRDRAPEIELMAKPQAAAKLRYRRVLLKLSGEALAGDKGYGIDLGVLAADRPRHRRGGRRRAPRSASWSAAATSFAG